MANWNDVEGNWDKYKDSVKAKWNKLTDDDVRAVAGKQPELVNKLKDRYQFTPEVANSQIKDWLQAEKSSPSDKPAQP